MKSHNQKTIKRNTLENPNLGECRHCDYHPVAINAHYCPHCGGSTPNPGMRMASLIGPVLFLIFVFLVFHLFSMMDNTQPLIEMPEVVKHAVM